MKKRLINFITRNFHKNMSSTTTVNKPGRLYALDPFCYRQWDATSNSNYIKMDKEKVTETINKLALNTTLIDGYAPFCKHLFIKNFLDLKPSCIKITNENKHLLISDYKSRTKR